MEQKTDYTTRIVNYALQTSGFYPLRPVQLWMIDTHFNKANSTMMNIGLFYKFSSEMDLNRLKDAINEILNRYDIFRCRLVFHEGTDDLCQRFDGEIFPVKVEKISDEEFENRKKFLKRPYKLINNFLYRIYLFETPSGKYGYFDFYHAMFDGMAVGILFQREMDMRYKGKKITREPLNYADFILNELRVSPEELAEGNKFWREITAGFDEKKHLPPADKKIQESWQSEKFFEEIKNVNHEYFSDRSRTEDIFFLAASMLAIAKSSGAKSSIMSRVHNGRMNAQERRLMGIMLEQYPINWDFSKDISVGNFLDGLEKKVSESTKFRRSLGTVYGEGLQDDCATFIFQKGVFGAQLGEVKIGNLPVEILDMPENKFSAAENTLDIEMNLDDEGNYFVCLDYDSSRYSENAMKNFAETLDKVILQLQDENKFISEILN